MSVWTIAGGWRVACIDACVDFHANGLPPILHHFQNLMNRSFSDPGAIYSRSMGYFQFDLVRSSETPFVRTERDTSISWIRSSGEIEYIKWRIISMFLPALHRRMKVLCFFTAALLGSATGVDVTMEAFLPVIPSYSLIDRETQSCCRTIPFHESMTWFTAPTDPVIGSETCCDEDNGETCCANGCCSSEQFCCNDLCYPQGNVCCNNVYVCGPGTYCCYTSSCCPFPWITAV